MEKRMVLARLLPYPLACALADAAMVGASGSKERIIAIDEAAEKCRRAVPGCFRADASGGQVDRQGGRVDPAAS